MVNSGPGLVFITYPEVVLKLPGGPIWAFLFFIMLVVRNIFALISNISRYATTVPAPLLTVVIIFSHYFVMSAFL